ncbi:MAG: LD-carboxypeptidase [Solobacterium sp.]|nr:LD-carboxypeptidase [Solobacterium sp.]
MIFPEFLDQGDLIMISAPSAGVGRKLESFDHSLEVLRSAGFRLQETASVRLNDMRGGDALTRAEEFAECFRNPGAKMAACAAGGDFLFETLPYIDWEVMKENPKWLMGASDPTSLLYGYLTKCDTAVLYGMNAGSFDVEEMYPFIRDSLDIIKGRHVVQHSYDKYASVPFADELVFDKETEWKSPLDELDATARAIGGCLDVLKDLIGTPYEDTKGFVRKYKDDGLIWFLDVYSMPAEHVYRTLLQMKYAGWLDHTKAVVLGRVLFSSSETGMTYEEALRLACGDIPYVYDADVGHTDPCMTLILGAKAHLKYRAGKASLEFLCE